MVMIFVTLLTRASGEVTTSRPLGALLSTKTPTLVISAVSVRRLFRSNLNQERFDNYLQTAGPDYVLKVQEPGRAQELIGLLGALNFTEASSPDNADLRYRVEVQQAGEPFATIYIGAFGELVYEGRRWQPKANDWLHQLWKVIETDVLK
jgi:hypothetical protein